MIAAFFHDAPLVKSKNGNVYSIGFPYKIWERYLNIFDSIIVSTRMRFDNSEDGNKIKKMKLSSGPRVEFQPISKYNKPTDSILNKKEITNQIREVLKKSDRAIIRLPSFIGNLACKEAIKLDKPYLIEVVGCGWDSLWNHSIVGKIVALPNYLIMRKSIKNSNYVIYVTDEYLQNKYPTKGISTNCSNVALEEFDDRILKKRIEKVNNMNKTDKIVIGTIGSVDVKYKGQQSIIKAIAKLKKIGITKFEYQIVGGGNPKYLRSLIEKYKVSDHVKLIGPIPHQDVYNWLDTIDIYAQPSKTEGLPRALIEAMSRGLLAIGTDAGGIPELLEKEFIVSKSNGNEKEINHILTNIKKQDLLTQAKRNFNLAKKYDKSIIDSRRQRILRKLYYD